MQANLIPPRLAALLPLVLAGTLAAETLPSWTASDGRTIQAKFLKLDGEAVVIEKNGQAFTIPFAKLSPASVALARGLGPPPPPEIEFKVLLVIKRKSDTYSPLFLPVRSSMTEGEIARARRCFEVETPDMVRDITGGKVRFTPTVYVSDKPLRLWDPKRLDSAEYYPPELLEEFRSLAKPGQFDSAGCYFLHYDAASGYKIPRAGYGVGGFNGSYQLGMFAVNCTPGLNPRDEIFLHEWMHGLDGFFGSKEGVTLPKGMLHGGVDHGYREKVWRPGDTFRGWMEWYRDYLNGQVRENGALTGLGSTAWNHGPMRLKAPRPGWPEPEEPISAGAYPAWVHELMKGDLRHAALGPPLLETELPSGPVSATAWKPRMWNERAGTEILVVEEGGPGISIRSPSPNDAALSRKVMLQPSTNYIFTAEVRTENVEITEAGGAFGANLYAGDSVSTLRLTASLPWTRVVLPFTTGPKEPECTIKLAVGGFGSIAQGRAVFRNIQVRAVGYPSFPANLPSRAE